eukprot:TRINITY_DN6492_c0_g1_i1.p1 TRINITY_DN6492_c0_g1~~TRINITY_DN6492_c0_g1_i1.p1  ORF type:complete len:358 (+),score=55.77 TRINITY_DN6492_c0_g1_i1:98-1075(+)
MEKNVLNRNRAGLFGGMLALAALCAVVVVMKPWQTPSPTTVRALLDSSDLRDIISENLVAMGEKQDLDDVKKQVGAQMALITAKERARIPTAHARLDAQELSSLERSEILRSMRTLGDPRMVRAGSSLWTAAKETVENKGDRDDFKRRVVKKLAPQRDNLRQLSDVLLHPKEGQSEQNVNLDAERSRVMPAFDTWHAQEQPATEEVKQDPKIVSEDAVKSQVSVLARLVRKIEKEHATKGRRLPEATDVSDTPYCIENSDGGYSGMKSFSLCIQYSVSNMSPSYLTQCMSQFVSSMTDFMGSDDKEPTPCQQQGGYINGVWTPSR